MSKSATRTATRGTRARSLTQSCESVVARIQAVHDEANARLDQAGDLRSALESGIDRLSKMMTLLRDAGPTADEVRTLCAIIDARERQSCATTSKTAEAPSARLQAAGGTST